MCKFPETSSRNELMETKNELMSLGVRGLGGSEVLFGNDFWTFLRIVQFAFAFQGNINGQRQTTKGEGGKMRQNVAISDGSKTRQGGRAMSKQCPKAVGHCQVRQDQDDVGQRRPHPRTVGDAQNWV